MRGFADGYKLKGLKMNC